MTALLTMGEVAARLSVPVHRVRYVVRSRRIWADRVGQNRVFDLTQVDLIRQELERIGRQRPVMSD